MLIATDTLIPTSPPPAPLVVVALKVCVEAIAAETVAPVADTVAPAGSVAVLITRT
jgi:hypothetical protein